MDEVYKAINKGGNPINNNTNLQCRAIHKVLFGFDL